MKNVTVAIDKNSKMYVPLGKGLNLYAGADGKIGTTDDLVRGFGRYPQSDVTGALADPLDWRILDIRGDQATLVASVLVDSIQFNLNPGDGNDWARSNLRAWLNSSGGQNASGNTTGFYDAAFSDSEKAQILPTRVNVKSSTAFIAYNRLLAADHWQTYKPSTTDTRDKVWTLSGGEVFRYFGRSRIATRQELGNDPANYTNAYLVPSEYAKAMGVKVNVGGNGPSFSGFGDAWTRSAGAPSDGANYYGVFLGSTGSLNSGRPVNTVYGALPVITVTLNRRR